jgi:hypothetical protein
MPSAQDIIERARMFDERADRATDPISRQHYREMAAHYRIAVGRTSGNKGDPAGSHLRKFQLISDG